MLFVAACNTKVLAFNSVAALIGQGFWNCDISGKHFAKCSHLAVYDSFLLLKLMCQSISQENSRKYFDL
jgi:hypothetical protein